MGADNDQVFSDLGDEEEDIPVCVSLDEELVQTENAGETVDAQNPTLYAAEPFTSSFNDPVRK